MWTLDLICCGRDDGAVTFDTWDAADDFRESYTSGVAVDPHGFSGDGHVGHQRAAILRRAEAERDAFYPLGKLDPDNPLDQAMVEAWNAGARKVNEPRAEATRSERDDDDVR